MGNDSALIQYMGLSLCRFSSNNGQKNYKKPFVLLGLHEFRICAYIYIYDMCVFI